MTSRKRPAATQKEIEELEACLKQASKRLRALQKEEEKATDADDSGKIRAALRVDASLNYP